MTDFFIVMFYIIIVLAVGIFYSRNVKSMRDFSSSNKSFSAPVIMATISATYIGGEFLFGIAEKSFNVGIIFFFALLGTCLGKWFLANSVVPRVSKFADAISIGEIMQENYGMVGRVVTGLSGALLSIGFVGAQIGSCSLLFEYFFNFPHMQSIFIACAIVVIYSAFGGFKAVTFTDVVQFGVLIVVVPIICNYALNEIGGYPALLEKLPELHLYPTSSIMWEHAVWFVVFLVPFLDPALMQRMTMDRDTRKVATAWRMSALVDVPFYLVVCLIGMIAMAAYPDAAPQAAFLSVINNLPSGLVGLAITGILAVVMSTADSYLNVASILLVHDVIKPIWGKSISDRRELRLAQMMTVLIGVLAIIAAYKLEGILDYMVSFMNYSWVPFVVAPLYARIYGFKTGAKSFVVAGLCGFSSQFCWPFLFGIDSEVFALMMTPIISGLALFISHHAFQKTFPNFLDLLQPLIHVKRRILSFRTNTKLSRSKNNVLDILINASNKCVEDFGASYSLFGLFAVLNYIVPYFMWSSTNNESFHLHLLMRFVASVLSFGLIVHDYWPQSFQKYIPLYWHVTLLYCLPFFSTFMLLDNQGAAFWIYNIVLALFLLAALVDWISFIVLLSVGSSTAYLFFVFIMGKSTADFNVQNLYTVVYMYIFAVIIGIIFSRRNEKIIQEKMQLLKTLSTSIAHEMRTPLATIALGANNLEKYIPLYSQAYQNAKDAGLEVPHITMNEQILLRDIPQTLTKVSSNAQNIITMLLMKVKERPAKNDDLCSITHCIETALQQYPLKNEERAKITWIKSSDFLFAGKEEMCVHILFNLIKNALHQIAHLKHGVITIFVEESSTANYLHFKDNGNGVPRNMLPHIFDRFISGTEFGTGMGLSYCKMVMSSFGGAIECISNEGEGAEFVLRFPKVKNFD